MITYCQTGNKLMTIMYKYLLHVI